MKLSNKEFKLLLSEIKPLYFESDVCERVTSDTLIKTYTNEVYFLTIGSYDIEMYMYLHNNYDYIEYDYLHPRETSLRNSIVDLDILSINKDNGEDHYEITLTRKQIKVLTKALEQTITLN